MNKTMLFVVALAVVAGCRHVQGGSMKSAAPFLGDNATLPGVQAAEPLNGKPLERSGALALFSGETAEDAAFNEAERQNYQKFRNSLFLRRRMADGTYEWRLLLTTGSDWRVPAGLGDWCSEQAGNLKRCFCVNTASFSSDGQHLWLVCDTGNYMWSIVCAYDVNNNMLRPLIDGDSATEQPDGTILVKGKKVYLYDKNGEPDGAGLCDVWITPEGNIIRKSKPERLNN